MIDESTKHVPVHMYAYNANDIIRLAELERRKEAERGRNGLKTNVGYTLAHSLERTKFN